MHATVKQGTQRRLEPPPKPMTEPAHRRSNPLARFQGGISTGCSGATPSAVRSLPVTRLALMPLCLALSVGAPCHGTVLNPVSAQDLVLAADLIFEGVVVDVSYRSSRARLPGQEALPHTFVTFDITDTIKGTSQAGATITLRFLGGPDETGHILTIDGIPLFDIGERGILFVRQNGVEMCPLVGWEQGRFRIVEEQIYTNRGREVWLRSGGGFAFGPRHGLREATEHRIGDVQIAEDMEHRHQMPPRDAVTQLQRSDFAVALRALLRELFSQAALDELPAAVSVSLQDEFTVKALRAERPPSQ